MRGNPPPPVPVPAQRGSIPACAGEPARGGGARAGAGVYPRVCGGTLLPLCTTPATRGLSPRVRGNHHGQLADEAAQGSIPACAGEPSGGICAVVICAVYPRVCGGTAPAVSGRQGRRGLSPRVRGNHDYNPDAKSPAGSIPACAGEPDSRADFNLPPWSIPACAGEPDSRADFNLPPWSIPACAGEPPTSAVMPQPEQVYPRVCGGTRFQGRFQPPPMVYPRVCGGTADFRRDAAAGAGLSPRVRGNLPLAAAHGNRAGSIPACAGEPRPASPAGI